MTNNLSEAYRNVFDSSKEILRTKQRHMYKNMLDLLARTIKSSNASLKSKDLIAEEHIKFFCMEILPLVFDHDEAIQNNAILAVEVFLSSSDIIKCHDLPEWTKIKSRIVERHSEQLRLLQQSSDNSNWYKIWCQIIRLLDKEILKAVCINPYLSIVELSFRSNDQKIRSQAFICWKCLTEIFAKYNEISSSKRIKLVCIPLKSSQSRTLDATINKFKVWWYFLCKLKADKIEEHIDITLNGFLAFCFHQQQQQQHHHQQDQQQESSSSYIFTGRPNFFPIVKQMSIACFIEMFNTKSILNSYHENIDEDQMINLQSTLNEIRKILETKGLEVPQQQCDDHNDHDGDSSSIINVRILLKSSKLIMNSAFESTIMILEHNLGTYNFFKILWINLSSQIFQINSMNKIMEIYNEFFIQFKVFLQISSKILNNDIKKQSFNEIIQTFCSSNEFPLKYDKNQITKNDLSEYNDENDENLYMIIWNFTLLLIENGFKLMKSLKQLQEILKNLYTMKRYKIHVKEFFQFQIDFMKFIMIKTKSLNHNDDNLDNVNFINLMIWKYFTLSFVETLLNDIETLFEIRKNNENIDVLNEWLLWPLKLNFNNSGKEIINEIQKNHNFIEVWKNLAISVSKIQGQSQFSKVISGIFKEMIENEKAILSSAMQFCDVLNEFILCLDNTFDLSAKPIEFFELIQTVLSSKKLTINEKVKIIISLNSYVKTFKAKQIIDTFQEIKSILTSIIRLRRNEKNLKSLKCLEDEFNRSLQEKLKSTLNTTKLCKELKDLIKKNNDNNDYVIIPSVWSLEPDKLTEHQKEKMKEKRCDIPALYNDISQSHDTNSTSIKPWTPKKIVIAKDSNAEIAILSTNDDNNEDSNDVAHEQQQIEVNERIQKDDAANDVIFEKNKSKIRGPKRTLESNFPKKQQQRERSKSPLPSIINSESVLKTQRSPIKRVKLNNVTPKSPNRNNRRRSSIDINAVITATSVTVVASTDKKNNNNENNTYSNDDGDNLEESHVSQILDKINVPIEDEEKRRKVLRQLKSIKIDTVEGNTVIEGKLRRRSSMATTRPLSITPDEDSEDGDGGIKKKKRTAAKLSSKEIPDDKTPSTVNTNATVTITSGVITNDESNTITAKPTIKLPSSSSTTKPARKSLLFEKDKTKANADGVNNDLDSMPKPLPLSNDDNLKPSEVETTKITINNEKEKTDNDSLADEVIGSSQQCESVFAKKFILRKSMTSSVTPDRVSSPNKKKSSSSLPSNKKGSPTSIENPTVPDDLNGAHMPTTTASESRETAKSIPSIDTEEVPETNEEEPNKFNTTVVSTMIPNDDDCESQRVLPSSSSKISSTNANEIDGTDTESFKLSSTNYLPNSSSTIIKSPLREVYSVFTLNSSSSPQQQTQIPSNNNSNSIIVTENKISEADTQPNTDNNDSSKSNSPITPNEQEQQNVLNISTISPELSPLIDEKSFSISNNIAKSPITCAPNKSSVISSPELGNIEERTTEFLNNTLNISPIIMEGAMKMNNEIISDSGSISSTTENRNNTNDITKSTSPPGRKLKLSATSNLSSSPPDRKSSNMSFIPAIKPKPVSQLVGRGAQFINMIRNKNNESTPKQLISLSNAGQQIMLNIQEQQQQKQKQLQQNNQEKLKISNEDCSTTTTCSNNVLTTPSHNPHRDLLVFSKTLPSLDASPSASILKRKLCKESFDEITSGSLSAATAIESPGIKRKRVSFHEPPVSVTKEYVTNSEEHLNHRPVSLMLAQATAAAASSSPLEKPNFTRCLILDNTSTPQNIKKFKRISRTDSMKSIEKFTKESPSTTYRQSAINLQSNTDNKNTSSKCKLNSITLNHDNETTAILSNSVQISTEMESLKWGDSINDNTSKQQQKAVMNTTSTKPSEPTTTTLEVTNPPSISEESSSNDKNTNIKSNEINNKNNDNDDDDENSLTPSPSLYFSDEQSVLNYVLEKFPFETIVEEYLNNLNYENDNDDTKSQSKSLNKIMKLISNKMLHDSKLRANILEIFSESHPIEFLEHAIQENLSSTVCDKLNSNSIIEYICEKSKLKLNVRKLLLERVQNLIKLDKLHNDNYGFIVQLINNHKLTNDEILNLIQLLVTNRNQKYKNSTPTTSTIIANASNIDGYTTKENPTSSS